MSEKDSVNVALVNPEDREEYHRSLGLTKKIESRKIILVGRSRCGKTTLIRRLHNLDMSYHKTQSIEAWSDAIDTPGEYTDTPFFSRGAAITPAYDADIVCFCHDCGNDICRLPQMFSMSFAKPVIGTRVPAPAFFAMLSYTPMPVKRQERKIRDTETMAFALFSVRYIE